MRAFGFWTERKRDLRNAVEEDAGKSTQPGCVEQEE